jgi:RNA polymerase sigma-70 factor (ECF subfamily)
MNGKNRVNISKAKKIATSEDSTLIALALAGQTECFAALVDRHLAAVRRRIAFMVRDAADVDDLLQEVLLQVWRHLATFRSESSFRTWMTRVAINEVLQSHRREQRRPLWGAVRDLDAVASPAESPHQSLARVEVTQSVHSALVRLPEKYKRVLILRDLHELSARETAEFLHSTIPAVKTQLFRARIQLRAALRRSMVPGVASADPGRSVVPISTALAANSGC